MLLAVCILSIIGLLLYRKRRREQGPAERVYFRRPERPRELENPVYAETAFAGEGATKVPLRDEQHEDMYGRVTPSVIPGTTDEQVNAMYIPPKVGPDGYNKLADDHAVHNMAGEEHMEVEYDTAGDTGAIGVTAAADSVNSGSHLTLQGPLGDQTQINQAGGGVNNTAGEEFMAVELDTRHNESLSEAAELADDDGSLARQEPLYDKAVEIIMPSNSGLYFEDNQEDEISF